MVGVVLKQDGQAIMELSEFNHIILCCAELQKDQKIIKYTKKATAALYNSLPLLFLRATACQSPHSIRDYSSLLFQGKLLCEVEHEYCPIL